MCQFYPVTCIISRSFDDADQQQSLPKFVPQATFHDPAIMSARFGSPMLSSDSGYHISTALENRIHLADGPPPGLSYPQGSSVLSNIHAGQPSKTNTSARGEYFFHFFEGRVSQGQVYRAPCFLSADISAMRRASLCSRPHSPFGPV